MKFFIVIAAVLATAAAGIIGQTAQSTVAGANNAVDAASKTLTDAANDGKGVIAGVAGTSGIAGGIIDGGAGDLVGQIVDTVDQATGLDLGCVLQNVLGE